MPKEFTPAPEIGVEEEKKEITSRILISLFRHGKKEKEPKDNPPLTAEGKKEAKEKSAKYAKSSNLNQGMAFGSPFIRAQETAGYIMAGQEDWITGNETPEELLKKLSHPDIPKITKIRSDERLGFHLDKDSEYGKEFMENFKKGRGLEFTVKESDQLAQEKGDKESFTYSRNARNIAEVVKKYLKIAVNWNRIVEKKGYKAEQANMERFLGSHQIVQESFLCKVVEKIKGEKERDKLIQALDGKGFDELEGFDIEIDHIEGQKNPELKVIFRKENENGKVLFDFSETVPNEVLQEIIEEGKEES